MREFGIILLVLLTITFLVTTYLLIKDSIWLKRLNKYRTSESLKPIKPSHNILQKRFTTLALSFVMILAITPILTFNQKIEPPFYVDKQMVNVKTVGSKEKLVSMIDNYNNYYYYEEGIVWEGNINGSADLGLDGLNPGTVVGNGDTQIIIEISLIRIIKLKGFKKLISSKQMEIESFMPHMEEIKFQSLISQSMEQRL